MDSSLSSTDSDDEGIGDKEKKMKILKKKKKRVRVSSLAGHSAAPKVLEVALQRSKATSSGGGGCTLQDPVKQERTENNLNLFNEVIHHHDYFDLNYTQ